MRLKGKTAIVVGAGQQPGSTIGNGRAIAVLFAREGADVLCVDRDLARAEETVALIVAEAASARLLPTSRNPARRQFIVAAAKERLGRIDP